MSADSVALVINSEMWRFLTAWQLVMSNGYSELSHKALPPICETAQRSRSARTAPFIAPRPLLILPLGDFHELSRTVSPKVHSYESTRSTHPLPLPNSKPSLELRNFSSHVPKADFPNLALARLACCRNHGSGPLEWIP